MSGENIGTRIRVIRQRMGLTQPDAAAAFGIKYGSYMKYETGSSEPGASALAGFARAGISTNWLLTGEGEMLLKDTPAAADIPSEVHSVPSHSTAHHVMREPPPAGYAFKTGDEPSEEDSAVYIDNYVDVRGSCGPGQYVGEEAIVKVRFDADLLRRRVGSNFNHIKIVGVHGDSMEPTLLHGDQVLIDTSCDRFIDDAIYAIQQDGHLRFKRIKLKLDGTIIVRSDNPANNEPETYTAEEAQYFKVVGMVIPFKFGRFKV